MGSLATTSTVAWSNHLKALFEGPYYLVGVLLFLGVLVTVVAFLWQMWSSHQERLRADAMEAVKLAEWIGMGDGYNALVRAFHELEDSPHSGTLLGLFPDDPPTVTREEFDALHLSLKRRTTDVAGKSLCTAAETDTALSSVIYGETAAVSMLHMLDIFAAKVQRGPCHRPTAYVYCAFDFCDAVGRWAPLIAYMRANQDRQFFSDGIDLYLEWDAKLRQEGRIPVPEPARG